MLQYKDPKGILRPIPASSYREEDRESYGPTPYDADTCTFCLCNGLSINSSKEWSCDKYMTDSTDQLVCGHLFMGLCLLSQIDEVDLVKVAPERDLPLLIGFLKTELGMEELKGRFKEYAPVA